MSILIDELENHVISGKQWTHDASLQWRHNERDGVPHQLRHDCLLNCLSRRKIKHQSSALLAFVRGIHRRPVNSTHKEPVTQKRHPFDDIIMCFRGCRTAYVLIGLKRFLWGETIACQWNALFFVSHYGNLTILVFANWHVALSHCHHYTEFLTIVEPGPCET